MSVALKNVILLIIYGLKSEAKSLGINKIYNNEVNYEIVLGMSSNLSYRKSLRNKQQSNTS